MATLEDVKNALAERGSEMPQSFVSRMNPSQEEQGAPVPEEDIDSLMERAKILNLGISPTQFGVSPAKQIMNPEDFSEQELALVTEQLEGKRANRVKKAKNMAITMADSAVLNAGTGLSRDLGLTGLEDTIRGARADLSSGERFVADMTGSLIPAGFAARLFGLGAKGASRLANAARAGAVAGVEGGVSALGLSEEETKAEQLKDAATGAAIGAGTVGLLAGGASTAGKAKDFVVDKAREAFNSGTSKSDEILSQGLANREEIGSALETARTSITGSPELNKEVKNLIDGPSGVSILKDLKSEVITFAENNFSSRLFNAAEKQELKPKDIFYDKSNGTFSVIKKGAKKVNDGYSEEDLVPIPMSGEAFSTARSKIEDKVKSGFYTQKQSAKKINSFSEADKAALGQNAKLVDQYAENEQGLSVLKKSLSFSKLTKPTPTQTTNFIKEVIQESPNVNPLDRYKIAMSAFAERDLSKSFKLTKEVSDTIAKSGLDPKQQKNFKRLLRDMSKSNGFTASEVIGETAKLGTKRAIFGSASFFYKVSFANKVIGFINKAMPNASAEARDRVGNELLSRLDSLTDGQREQLMKSAVDEYSPDVIEKQASMYVKSMLSGIGMNTAVNLEE